VEVHESSRNDNASGGPVASENLCMSLTATFCVASVKRKKSIELSKGESVPLFDCSGLDSYPVDALPFEAQWLITRCQ